MDLYEWIWKMDLYTENFALVYFNKLFVIQ